MKMQQYGPLLIMQVTVMFGCSMRTSSTDTDHDVQSIQIFFHFGRFNELDTFKGIYQKDLIPGIATTTMWLTQREQEIILTKVEQIQFFSLPDTLHRESNVLVFPDLGPQVLRINYRDQDKTVVWNEPISPQSKAKSQIDDLTRLLKDIILSRPEYKALPATKGGYL